jgi:hypothetical protein
MARTAAGEAMAPPPRLAMMGAKAMRTKPRHPRRCQARKARGVLHLRASPQGEAQQAGLNA